MTPAACAVWLAVSTPSPRRSTTPRLSLTRRPWPPDRSVVNRPLGWARSALTWRLLGIAMPLTILALAFLTAFVTLRLRNIPDGHPGGLPWSSNTLAACLRPRRPARRCARRGATAGTPR